MSSYSQKYMVLYIVGGSYTFYTKIYISMLRKKKGWNVKVPKNKTNKKEMLQTSLTAKHQHSQIHDHVPSFPLQSKYVRLNMFLKLSKTRNFPKA